jgi:enamine deaminase RidA (YjgF/YER057c/UK114 family)
MYAITERLAELGLKLPQPPSALASYVPYVVTGNLVFISGQLPMENKRVAVMGRVGSEVSVADGQKAARLCALNLLAQLNAACDGDLDRVAACVRLCGFVASAQDFYEQAKIMNGASDLIEQIFGEKGKHARISVGVSNLPLNAAVEIDGIFSLR